MNTRNCKKLILFDIDGTLLNTGGDGKEAMEMALKKLLIDFTNLDEIRFQGNTDYAIFNSISEIYPLLKEQGIEKFKKTYIQYLQDLMPAESRIQMAIPHARSFLQFLQKRNEFCIGLVTGNFKNGAQIKLKATGLDSFFDFEKGGYGCDAPHRTRLVEKAMIRNEFTEKFRVLLIGDTIHDAAAGKEAGIRVMGVTTGVGEDSVKDLLESGCDLVVNNLGEIDEIMLRAIFN
ncbi:MAG: HAD family hydrolase [Deltaproteobacteria bacterium]|jgi:phosphoglycolate phosphatase|nr:HAD family hydrolase [Deltaproteobacteria bacterium]